MNGIKHQESQSEAQESPSSTANAIQVTNVPLGPQSSARAGGLPLCHQQTFKMTLGCSEFTDLHLCKPMYAPMVQMVYSVLEIQLLPIQTQVYKFFFSCVSWRMASH